MRRKWKKRAQATAAATPRREDPRAFRLAAGKACGLQAAAQDGDTKLGTFEGTAYTGAVMRPGGWWNDIIVDLSGVVVPSENRPALRQHDHEQIVGHTTSVAVDPVNGITIAGVFSGQREHVDKVVVPARNGFAWQLSIGADPIKTQYLDEDEQAVVNGQTVEGPLVISRVTELGEISFVPLGADGDTSVSVAAQRGKSTMNPFAQSLKQVMANLRAAGKKVKYTDVQIDGLSAEEAQAALAKGLKKLLASDDDAGDKKPKKSKKKDADSVKASLKISAGAVIKELRDGFAADLVRQREIAAACRRHSVAEVELDVAGEKTKVNLAEHAIANDWTVDQVKAHLLDHVRAERPQNRIGVPGGLGYSTSTPTINEQVMEAALLQAARHSFKLEDDSFYLSPTPDGKGMMRRVPERLQRETQGELKARYGDEVQQAAHTLFKGSLSPKQFLIAMFRQNGWGEPDLQGESGCRRMLATWSHHEPESGIRAEGASNLSIANILANVLNKFALQGYLFVEQSWRQIAGIRPVGDFKPAKSINLLGDVMFKALGPSGELANASLGDQAFANQAQPFGRILTIPWTHLVNDDLGILTGVPLKIGQGAGLALNDYFWALWASLASGSVVGPIPSGTNLNGDDAVSFWRTGSSSTMGKAYNKNKISGGSSALSSTSLTTAKAVFDNQIDPNKNPLGFDAGSPILLFGPSNWRTAMELMMAPGYVYGGASTALQPNVNVWQQMMQPVMSRYIENSQYVNSTTAWWILFNPAALPAIEVAFLNGVDTPAVLQASPDYQFDRLGISIRGTMPFGVTQQNFRGGVYAAGA